MADVKNLTPFRVFSQGGAGTAYASSAARKEVSSLLAPVKNSLQAGSVLYGVGHVIYSTTSTPTLTLDISVNGAAAVASAAITTGSGVSGKTAVVQFWGTVLTVGSAGTIMFAMVVNSNDFSSAPGIGNSTAATVDMATNDPTFALAATWGTSSSSNTLTCNSWFVAVLGS